MLTDLYQRILAQAQAAPDATAFIIRDAQYSYAQLLGRVAAIRRAIDPIPLPAEAPLIGVWTGDALDTYASLLASWGRRAGYVPLNHKFPPERNRRVAEEAGLTVVLAHAQSRALEEFLRGLVQPVQLVLTELIPTPELPQAHLAPYSTFHPEQLAYLLFTSGSTGRPKGVPILHSNLEQFFDTVLAPGLWQLGSTDRFLQMFELTFDLSVFSTFAPLLVGGTCCTVPEDGISYLNILRILEEQSCTVALKVPSVLAYLHKYFEEIDLPSLRLSLFCGEALPAKLATDWQARIPKAALENVYGPTEATIFCTRYPITPRLAEEAFRGVVPIGKAMPGVQLAVVDADRKDLSHNTSGELCLGGAQVTPGYWHNPEKNAEAFLDLNNTRYYRTGDVVQQDSQGNYLYLGRSDSQVKIDGYRVELGEIEHHARELSGAQQLAVIATQTEGGGWALHLFLEAYTGDTTELRKALQKQLPAYMVPRDLHVLPALPLNSNGKIDRPVLKARLG